MVGRIPRALAADLSLCCFLLLEGGWKGVGGRGEGFKSTMLYIYLYCIANNNFGTNLIRYSIVKCHAKRTTRQIRVYSQTICRVII